MRSLQFVSLAGCLLLVSAVCGCPSTGKVTSGTSEEATAEDLLQSAVHQLRPENYTIASAPDKPVNLLNSWHLKVSDAGATSAPLTPPAGWVDEAGAERLSATTYDERDAFYIRDAMLNHSIAKYLAARGPDEVGQIQAVFDFVVRNISLRSDDEPEMPLGVYELLLIGRGGAEDRAWVCAKLLGQLRIDSVIIRPAGEAETSDVWLLGVLLDSRIYLFDPRLGLAIPSTPDLSQASIQPATLDEIVSHPEWLEQFTVRADQPYAIDVDGLKQPVIQPIVELDSWPVRMKELEGTLPAEELCVLYDPLSDQDAQTGLLSRLQKCLKSGKADQLKPWGYPLQQRAATKVPNPAASQNWAVTTRIFSLPIPIIENRETGTQTIGTPEGRMLRIRIDQLLGKFEDANQRYLSIRHLEVEPVPAQELEILNRLGAEYAIYWSGVCKYEAQEYESAVEQLTTYVKRFDRNGRWAFAARALLAECHAKLGQFDQAIAVVDRVRSDDPYRDANAIRVKRWNAQKK
ncbi:MAG: CDC27 family protein [Planctomycetes bacterium]|nr:CDC27 family protein [Planctomycetota bacterium]